MKKKHYSTSIQVGPLSFANLKTTVERTGLSRSTLKRYRLEGKLTEGIHWVRLNSRVTRYNLPLLLDWIQHHAYSPHSHQQAIDNYLASLPSNQGAKRRSID